MAINFNFNLIFVFTIKPIELGRNKREIRISERENEYGECANVKENIQRAKWNYKEKRG